jgi:hypothetical protein
MVTQRTTTVTIFRSYLAVRHRCQPARGVFQAVVINHQCLDIAVSGKVLYLGERHPGRYPPGDGGVTDAVRPRLEADVLTETPHDLVQPGAGEARAFCPPVQVCEERPGMGTTNLDPLIDRGRGLFGQIHPFPFPPAFAEDRQSLALLIEVSQVKAHELIPAQPLRARPGGQDQVTDKIR